MSWRDWPSWFKGGIIGILFILVIVLLIISVPSNWGVKIMSIFFFGKGIFPIWRFILVGAIYFILGAFIGLIIRKIKNTPSGIKNMWIFIGILLIVFVMIAMDMILYDLFRVTFTFYFLNIVTILIFSFIMYKLPLPSWLKGGISGLVLLTYLTMTEFLNFLDEYLLSFDFLGMIACGGNCVDTAGLIHIITAPLSYIILGSLIGWIVGKIKKKEVSNR